MLKMCVSWLYCVMCICVDFQSPRLKDLHREIFGKFVFIPALKGGDI